jgi:hypothetical protein
VLLNIPCFEITATHIGIKPVSLLIKQFDFVSSISNPIFGSPKPVEKREEVQTWLAKLVDLRNAESSLIHAAAGGRRVQIPSQPSQDFATQIRDRAVDTDLQILSGSNLAAPIPPQRADNTVKFGSKPEPRDSTRAKLELLNSRARSDGKVPHQTATHVPLRKSIKRSRAEQTPSPQQVTDNVHRTTSLSGGTSIATPLPTLASVPVPSPNRRQEQHSLLASPDLMLQPTPKSSGRRQDPVTPKRRASLSTNHGTSALGQLRVENSSENARERNTPFHRRSGSQITPPAYQLAASTAAISNPKTHPVPSPSAGAVHSLPAKQSWSQGDPGSKSTDDFWAVRILVYPMYNNSLTRRRRMYRASLDPPV